MIKLAPVVETKYPTSSKISTDQLLQFLVTVQSVGTSQTFQIQDDNQLILIFGAPPTKTGTPRAFNYDFIIIFFEESETPELGKIRARLKFEGEKILQESKVNKIPLFLEFARTFFIHL